MRAATIGDRVGDFIIASGLAIFPLLPAGAGYLGRSWPWALEMFFLSMIAVGVAHALVFRSPRPDHGATESIRLVRRGYLTWVTVVVAGTVLGVMERGPFNAEILAAESADLVERLLRPMHQVADAMYPVRVGLTCLEGGLAFWLLTSVLRRTGDPRRRVNTAIDGCLIGLGLVSAIAIIQYFTRANLLEYWVRANPGLTRSHSTLDDPNSLASFLVLGIGLAGGVTWPPGHEGGWWKRGLPLIIVALAGGALVTTVSRAGLAALVIAAIVILISKRFSRWAGGGSRAAMTRVAARAAVALTLGLLALWAAALAVAPNADPSQPGTPAEAVLETLDLRQPLDRILKGRVEIWQAAVALGLERPVLGRGVGLFPRLYAAVPGADGPENAHNYFLQVFVEMGLVGLIGLLVLLATIALALVPPQEATSTTSASTRNLRVWLSVGVLAFVLTWVTGHPLLTLSNSLWFASVLAVGLTALRESE